MLSPTTLDVNEHDVARVLRALAARSPWADARGRNGGKHPEYLTWDGELSGIVALALFELGMSIPDIAALHCSAEQLHVACIPALARFNPQAIALLAYVQRQHDGKRIVSYVVEEALRPRFWHTYRWHRRHRPWMV